MTVGVEVFMGLAAILFAIGLFGALSKRSAIMVMITGVGKIKGADKVEGADKVADVS